MLYDVLWYALHGFDGIAPVVQVRLQMLVLRMAESLAGIVYGLESFRLSEALLGLLRNVASVLQRLYWYCFVNVFEVDLRSNSSLQKWLSLRVQQNAAEYVAFLDRQVHRRARMWNIKNK